MSSSNRSSGPREKLEVGQKWKARTARTKTISDLRSGSGYSVVAYIDSNDGQEWCQNLSTFKAWIEINGAKLEGRDA